MGWFELDPYRIRLSWLDRFLIATPTGAWLVLMVVMRLFAERRYDEHLIWFAAACLGTVALGCGILSWRRRRLREAVEPLLYRACPQCHHPLTPSGTTSVRCNECGFLGNEAMVVESWSQLFRNED